MARRGFQVGIAGAVCALVLAHAPQAFAQVLEIQPDGSIVRYNGPMVHLTIGARPITGEIKYADIVFFAPSDIAAAIKESSKRYAVPASIVEAVAWQESRFNQRAISPKGARGVMQLMPGTARGLGVDPANMKANIDGGAAYLAQQIRRFGDLRLALAAYNAGPEAVDRYGDVPPYAETQNYVDSILASLEPAVVVVNTRGERVE
jgi:soluble lytic murein transglycosylase-like protein